MNICCSNFNRKPLVELNIATVAVHQCINASTVLHAIVSQTISKATLNLDQFIIILLFHFVNGNLRGFDLYNIIIIDICVIRSKL